MASIFRDHYEYRVHPFNPALLTAEELNRVGTEGWLLVGTLPHIVFARRTMQKQASSTTLTGPKLSSVSNKRLVTVNDAAFALGVSRTKMYELINCGVIRVVRIGRSPRIPTDSIEEFVASEGIQSSGRCRA